MSDRDQLYPYADGQQFQGKSAQEVFQQIYEKNSWNIHTQDSVSGEGSTVEQTLTLQQELPWLLQKLAVKTILDLPCGDFHWMQTLDLQGINYTGADIVPQIIQQNQHKYGNAHRQFILKDLIHDPLPQADLLFCRDCLVHLSNQDVLAAIANIKASNIRYLMTTHFPSEDINKEIVTGGWRPLNFSLPPFDFPEPLEMLNENCSEMAGAFRDKSMAVWKIEDLKKMI